MSLNPLSEAVNNYIVSHGVRKTWIAEQLGISQQLLQKLLSKKNFSIEDANRVLAPLDCQIKFEIVKKED